MVQMNDHRVTPSGCSTEFGLLPPVLACHTAVRIFTEENAINMQRLWAPWRMEYIEQVDDDEGCFLCAAAESEDEREKLVLWRNDLCFSLLNRYPYNNGHLLISPYQHTGEMEELGTEQMAAQMEMLQKCRRILKEVMAPDGFNVGLNLGRSAGAGLVDHLHWHIVPRWGGDTNFMSVTGQTKVIPQSLEELWEQLRAAETGSPGQ